MDRQGSKLRSRATPPMWQPYSDAAYGACQVGRIRPTESGHSLAPSLGAWAQRRTSTFVTLRRVGGRHLATSLDGITLRDGGSGRALASRRSGASCSRSAWSSVPYRSGHSVAPARRCACPRLLVGFLAVRQATRLLTRLDTRIDCDRSVLEAPNANACHPAIGDARGLVVADGRVRAVSPGQG
jgi:hypothetical protein